jgi:hypothetical protein
MVVAEDPVLSREMAQGMMIQLEPLFKRASGCGSRTNSSIRCMERSTAAPIREV